MSKDHTERLESHMGVAAGKFTLGDRVRKAKGSSWQGRIVGFYSTTLTPIGYAVESEREPGSVQIYPETALVAVSYTDDEVERCAATSDLIQALSRMTDNRHSDGTSSVVSQQDRSTIISGCHDLILAARQVPTDQVADIDICPICAVALVPDDICAGDIDMGTCHAECLEGSPVVDLNTGEPTDGEIFTFRYGDALPSQEGSSK